MTNDTSGETIVQKVMNLFGLRNKNDKNGVVWRIDEITDTARGKGPYAERPAPEEMEYSTVEYVATDLAGYTFEVVDGKWMPKTVGKRAKGDIDVMVDDFGEVTLISQGAEYDLAGEGENLELRRKDD
jgi:hypothetical protein